MALKLEGLFKDKAEENLKIGADKTNTGLQISVKAVDTQKELASMEKVHRNLTNLYKALIHKKN